MSDLISREDVIRITCETGALETQSRVRDLPAVDAEPVKHGHWEHLGGDEWRCTNCGEIIHTEGSWEKPTSKYCCECGAKMDEVEETKA